MSDSSLIVVCGSRRNKTYHGSTDDVKSCRHQLGVDRVYAKVLWANRCRFWLMQLKPWCSEHKKNAQMHELMFVLLGAVMRRPEAAPKSFVLHLVQNAGCRVALIGFGDKAGESLYGLDPVYDWYIEQVNKHAKACSTMVFSLDLKLLSDQRTLFDTYHVKALPANRQALAGFVMDVASLLQIARFVEKAKQKLKDFGSMASLPSLAVRCVQLACRVEQRVEDPALLSFSCKRARFEKSDVSSCRAQHVFSGRNEKIRQEILCPKVFRGRSWSLWLDGFLTSQKKMFLQSLV